MIVLMGGEDRAPEAIDLASESQCVDVVVGGEATDGGGLFENFHHLKEACARLAPQVEGVDESQVVLKHELHLHHGGLEERLRLEDDRITHCQVGVRLHSVDLPLAFRIDEETLPRIGHYEGVGKLDDFLKKL
jgi:hypothetical protein